jgi:hypothetical protein
VDHHYAGTPGIAETDTECAHIIPFSLGSWSSDEEQYTTSKIWVSLNRCFPSLRAKINFTQSSINEPCNAITMDRSIHNVFGRFDIAFEAVDQPNTYQIRNYRPNALFSRILPVSGIVTFRQCSQYYQLPSPELLSVHATIAKILHATGKAEEADKILKDKDNAGVLAKDGTTDIATLLSTTSINLPYP